MTDWQKFGPYVTAVATFFGVLIGFRIVQRIATARLLSLAAKTSSRLDDLVVDLLGMVRSSEQYLIAFYAATRPFILPGWIDRGFSSLVVIVITFRIAAMLRRALTFLISQAASDQPSDPTSIQTKRTLTLLANAAVWIFGVLFVLSNLGFNITSMIAGLGIGGIAVALAAQAILGDLFSAMAIWLDRPFELGDFIVFDGFMGTVDDIGIKTTRIRSLSGELLIVPNASLTSSKIRNFRKMEDRRVVISLGVAYRTPHEKLGRLPSTIERIVRSDARTRFERAHLDKFGESSIDLEVVYWVLSPDYTVHMDVKEKILLEILKAFQAEEIEIPFPHRTVILEKP